MATLTNTKIKDTYKSLLKVSDNGNLGASLQEITDGEGNASGVQLNTGGDLTASGTVAFGSLKDSGENITITKFVDEADGIGANDNDTSIPTSAAVKNYVDTNVTAQDLDFAGDSGTGAVDLDSQTFTIAGTANEIETSASGQTITIGLPNNVNVAGNLAVDTDTLYVNSSTSRVGINTNTPSQRLHIKEDDTTAAYARVSNSAGVFEVGVDSSGNGEVGMVTADNLLFNTSGSERMRIDSSGRVGIGTSSPASINGFATNLTIAGSSASIVLDDTDASAFEIASVSNGLRIYNETSELWRIDSSGNVGIGTSTARSILETNGTISINDSQTTLGVGDTLAGLEIYTSEVSYNPPSGRITMPVNRILPVCEHANGDAFGMSFYTAAQDADSVERMRIDSSGVVQVRNQTPTIQLYNTDTSVAAAQELGSIDFYTSDISAARVSSYVKSIFDSAFGASYLTFGTSTGVSAPTERLRIDSSGRVGIGESAPASRLHASFSLDNDGIRLENKSRGHSYLFTTAGTDASTFALYDIDNSHFLQVSGTAGHQFFTGGSEKMRIDSSGRVGIGTSNPDTELHLEGFNPKFTITNTNTTSSGYHGIVFESLDGAGFTTQSLGQLDFVTSAGATGLSAQIKAEMSNSSGSGNIVFKAGTAGSPSEVVRITGNGLTFNGDTAAANALDDYEEGSFTPEFRDESGAITATYDVQTGVYTKIGNVVTFTISLGTDSVTVSNPTDQLRINLPFTVRFGTAQGFSLGYNYNFATGLNQYPTGIPSSDRLIFYSVNSVNASPASSLNTGTNSNRLVITGTYLTSS